MPAHGIVVGKNRMRGRDQASRLEMYFATAMLVFASGVAYVAFLPPAAGDTFVAAGESVVYSSLWAGGYLVLALRVGLQFRGVLTVFARNRRYRLLLFTYLLPEIIEPNSWTRLLLLFFTVTFCAWMASRFSLTQMIMTLHYVLPIVMVIHALSAFVNTGYEVDWLERENFLGMMARMAACSRTSSRQERCSVSHLFSIRCSSLHHGIPAMENAGRCDEPAFSPPQRIGERDFGDPGDVHASLCLWALMRNKIYLFYIIAFTSIVMAMILFVDLDLLFGALGRSSDLTGRTILWEHWPGFLMIACSPGTVILVFFVQGGPAERLWALDDFHAPIFDEFCFSTSAYKPAHPACFRCC